MDPNQSMTNVKYQFEQQKSPFPSQYHIEKMLNVTKRIYLATHKQNKIQVAIKELISNNSTINKYNQREKSFAEMCQSLSQKEIYNPHVLKYYEVIFKESSTFIVMEPCECDLEKKLYSSKFHQKPKTDEFFCQALVIFKQVLVGYQYLLQHFGPQFMHRDIKPQNVLYSAKQKIYKLCDFGLCKINDFDHPTANVGTQNFMAPEVQGGQDYDNKCDIYSMGVLLFWIITGETNISNLRKYISNQYLLEILDWMLLPIPEQRISWSNLLQNNFFILSPEEFLAQGKYEPQISLISTQAFSQIIPNTRKQEQPNQNGTLSQVNTSYLKQNNFVNYLTLNTLFADAFKQLPENQQKITTIQRCLFALWSKIYDKAILNENNQELKKELNKCKEIIQLQQLLRLQNQNNEICDLNIEFSTITELCKYLLKKINLWQENKVVMKKFQKFLERNEKSQNIVFPEQ